MALTAAKRPVQLAGKSMFNFGVVANVTCFQGGLAMLASGNLRPARVGQGANVGAQAADAALCRVVGIFEAGAIGGAVDGAIKTDVRADAFLMKNGTAGDALTAADVGRACYVIDDETVGKTNPGAIRPVAGAVLDVTPEGVFVDVGAAIAAALTA